MYYNLLLTKWLDHPLGMCRQVGRELREKNWNRNVYERETLGAYVRGVLLVKGVACQSRGLGTVALYW